MKRDATDDGWSTATSQVVRTREPSDQRTRRRDHRKRSGVRHVGRSPARGGTKGRRREDLLLLQRKLFGQIRRQARPLRLGRRQGEEMNCSWILAYATPGFSDTDS